MEDYEFIEALYLATVRRQHRLALLRQTIDLDSDRHATAIQRALRASERFEEELVPSGH